MNWARAIEVNQSALVRIVEALIAMVGLQAGAALARLPKPLYYSVLRILRPAEAAVRRLIVIAARDVVVKPQAARAMPKGLKRAGNRTGTRIAFQLIDPRQRFQPWWQKVRLRKKRPQPRIWFLDDTPPNVISYRPEDIGKPEPPPQDGKVDGSSLGRRLQAIQQALADLPHQARRLVRWRLRRQAKAKFTSVLRPGRPPGRRKKETHEVDAVLKECHALARHIEREDSS